MSTSATGEIMLFGVRLVVDSLRKSVSLNNLSQYALPQEAALAKNEIPTGYASADESAVAVPNPGNRERKRGVPWTEEEHKLFLVGLQKVGKGDWRGISRSYVKSRTPTQVASHAQKYYLRRCNINRRRRRSSLFDITTEAVAGNSESPLPQTSVQGTGSGSELSNNISFLTSTPMASFAEIGHYLPEKSTQSFTFSNNYPVANFDLNETTVTEASLNLSLDLSCGQSSMISVT